MTQQLDLFAPAPAAPIKEPAPRAVAPEPAKEESDGIDLRPYQVDSIEALREGLREGKKNQILCAPTGAGKTIMAAKLLAEAHRKGRRAIFLADRIALIDQTSAVLDRYNIPHGVIQANHWRTNPGSKIQVASAQTLGRRGWPSADLLIVDECHGIIKHVVEKIKPRQAVCIGLTATPFTRGLGKHYDGIVNVTTTNRLTDDGFLVPFKVFAANEPDMSGAKVVAGEWTDTECSSRALKIVGDAVAEYLKHANGKKFIAFGCDVNHCRELQRQFMGSGIQCELYTYMTGDEERAEMLREFRKPESFIRGLISVAALSKGFDAPDVEAIIMCRPLRSSLIEHIQILGRGLRPHPTKEICTVLDLSGNCVRFWDEMHEFFENGIHELDMGHKAEKKKPKPKERKPVKCPRCKHVHAPRPSCPACGFEYPSRSNVSHESGELREIGGARGKVDDGNRQHWWSQLRTLAKDRGYKPGWAYFKFRERFGVEPKGMDDHAEMSPSPQVLSFVRKRMIAHAFATGKIKRVKRIPA